MKLLVMILFGILNFLSSFAMAQPLDTDNYCDLLYPRQAIQQKESGIVVVRRFSNESMKLSQSGVVFSNASPMLEDTALKLLESCHDINSSQPKNFAKAFRWSLSKSEASVESVEIRRPEKTTYGCPKGEYPVAARRLEESGAVVVRYKTIEDTGEVSNIKIHKTSGFSRLDIATIMITAGCRFKPGSNQNKKEDGWSELTYVWRLE